MHPYKAPRSADTSAGTIKLDPIFPAAPLARSVVLVVASGAADIAGVFLSDEIGPVGWVGAASCVGLALALGAVGFALQALVRVARGRGPRTGLAILGSLLAMAAGVIMALGSSLLALLWLGVAER